MKNPSQIGENRALRDKNVLKIDKNGRDGQQVAPWMDPADSVPAVGVPFGPKMVARGAILGARRVAKWA